MNKSWNASEINKQRLHAPIKHCASCNQNPTVEQHGKQDSIWTITCDACDEWVHHKQGAVMTDNVNHPAHYESNGPFECIELAEQYNFCLGNAIKYVWRHMDKGKPFEDLSKALWYIQREIDRTDCEYSPAPMGALSKLFALSDMDYAHMADFWYALFDGSLIDAKQEIQARIEKLTANYRTRVILADKITQQTIR